MGAALDSDQRLAQLVSVTEGGAAQKAAGRLGGRDWETAQLLLGKIGSNELDQVKGPPEGHIASMLRPA